MRKKFFSLLTPFFIITALLLTACSQGETNFVTKTRCTITFNTLGASLETPEPITVARGGIMGNQYPDDPVNTDDKISFYGWYDSGIRYEQDSVINSDLDLTARWVREQDTVRVTFNADGGIPVPSMQVFKNEPIGLRIPVTRKPGYIFEGWFSGSTKYTAAGPAVTAVITLTAHWTEKPKHTVTFITNDVNFLSDPDADQCDIDPIDVYEGEGLEDALPSATHSVEKIKFVRWIGPEGELYDEWTPINEPMTFHAKWGLDPYRVDLSKVSTAPGQGEDLNAQYFPETQSIKNEIKNYATNRWYILYRIGLDDELPEDFNMGYYTRYTVRAKFYGNERAILGHEDYASGYMDAKNAITEVGQEMPPKAGYGQISWCTTPTSDGSPGQSKSTVIAQQYNLGTTTINNQWLVAGTYEGSKEDAIRPKWLLIQTSDSWIGWIEIAEIAFHNGEDEFVLPPVVEE
jgi:uncharacterized repeat protein (TIGR02543 family)